MSRQLQLLCNERLQQRSTPRMAGWTAPSCAWTALWTPKGACHTKTAHHASSATLHEQLLLILPAMRFAWWCGYMPQLMLDAMCWMLQQCSGAPAPAGEACGNMRGSAAALAAAEPASSRGSRR